MPASTVTSIMRLTYSSPSSTDASLVSLFLQKPNDVAVSVNGVGVPSQEALPTLSDVAGTNQFNPQGAFACDGV